jgi:hypothetical protein
MVNRFIILAGVVLLARIAGAQNAVEDIRKMNLSFAKEQLAMELNYRIYPDSVSKEPIQSEDGRWVRVGLSQYQELGNIEIIRKAGELQVTFDHENKIAVVSDAPVSSGDDVNTIAGLNALENVMDQCRWVRYRSVNVELAAYDLYPNGSEFSRMTVIYNKKSYAISKLILQYATSISDDETGRQIIPRMEIAFKPIENNSIPVAKLDLGKYVIKKGTGYELTAPYKEYQLSNYLLTN